MLQDYWLRAEASLIVDGTSKVIGERSESRRAKRATENESLHGRYCILNTSPPKVWRFWQLAGLILICQILNQSANMIAISTWRRLYFLNYVNTTCFVSYNVGQIFDIFNRSTVKTKWFSLLYLILNYWLMHLCPGLKAATNFTKLQM